MKEQTITINGTVYDAATGMPVEQSEARSAATPITFHTERVHPSHTVHQQTQKSHTLNRHVVYKPAAKISQPVQPKPTTMRSPAISKFAPHPSGTPSKPPAHVIRDIAPMTHPIVQRAATRQPTRAAAHAAPAHVAPVPKPAVKPVEPAAAPAVKPSQVLKNEAIAEAMSKTPSKRPNKKAAKHAVRRHKSRFVGFATASLALLLVGGYFTYLNMPNLSVRVAAVQAGVGASYPGYHPDGYSLQGPVAYSDGQVRMTFGSNGGPQSFTVAQTKTNWDSTAVKANYADDKWGDDNTDTLTEGGLTIYTHNGDAAWVNNGVLYTISGDAPLSSSQIRRLAASM